MSAQHALDALQRFLPLGDSPEDGAALFDAYASDARLFYNGGISPMGELDRDAFAATWRFTQGLMGRRERPVFEALALHRVEEESDSQVVAWFTATERASGQAVYLAGGFANEAGAWKIDWLLVDKAPQPLTFATGRMQALADFAFGLGAGMLFPSSWLEVSHHRHFGIARPPLLTLPDTRFGCQSRAGCCTASFRIEVPEAAQHAIDAIPWETVRPDLVGKTQLEPLNDGDLLLKNVGETCRFLDEKNHCMIHAAVGRAIFPVCAQYPFVLTPVPEGLAVAASYACGTVRANFGPPLEERADDLYERAAMGRSAPVPAVVYLAQGYEVEWEEFAEAHETLMNVLERTELPLHRRLWMMGRLIQAWCEDEPVMMTGLEAEQLPVSEGPMRTLQTSMVRYFCRGFDDPSLHEPLAISHDQGLEPQSQIVGLMKQMFHSRALSMRMSLSATFNLAVITYLQALQANAAQPDQPISASILRELAIQMQHGRLLAYMVKLAEQGIDMRDLLGDPSFGLGLLAYPTPHQVGLPVEAEA